MTSLRYGMALALVLTGAAACGLGDVGDPSLPKTTPPGPPQVTNDKPTTEDCIQPACQTFPLPVSPHAVRLTNPQWERTVRDLLKLPMLPGNSAAFPTDPAPTSDRFGSEASGLVVTTEHWIAYQTAAEALAELVVDDANAVDALLPDAAKSGDTAPRIAAFVAAFLPRAYRRAVTAKETADVIAAAEKASVDVSAGDPFLVRMRWILTTVLQSPKFLYRISFGDGEVKDKRARMSGYEIASKLSYGLWGTMPDDPLMALTAQG